MARRFRLLIATILSIAFVAGMGFTAAAEDFYKGKTITFVVGFSAGGGFDTYTRLIARHFGKHVPGNPTTVVQNMTGAGSLVAANYTYNQAKPDGTVIGNWIGPLVLQYVMGNRAVQLDGRKFGYLGIPTPASNVCALTKASGIKNVDDWLASKKPPIKFGGTGPGATTVDGPKLLKAATALPIEVIEGYGGTAKIRLAAESGEIHGGCWPWQSVKATWRKGIDSGNVRVVLQLLFKSHPELKHIPLAVKYAKNAEARELLGVLNDVYGAAFQPYSIPPRTPKDRLRVLQKAFIDTMRDPELLAEAKKSKLEIDPTDGPTAAKLFARIYDMDPALLSRLKEIVVPGK
jgi:tripartite-type tricarboxylate transporter receptor subunit TctC